MRVARLLALGAALVTTSLAFGPADAAVITYMDDGNEEARGVRFSTTDEGLDRFYWSFQRQLPGNHARLKLGTYNRRDGIHSDDDYNLAYDYDESWKAGVYAPFSLEYNGQTASFSALGQRVDYDVSFGERSDFNGLHLLLRSERPEEGAALKDVILNGQLLGGLDANDPRKTLEWWHLSEVGDLNAGFTLSGQIAFYGEQSSFQRLAVYAIDTSMDQVNAPTEVPEPASGFLLLTGLGILGAVAGFRGIE